MTFTVVIINLFPINVKISRHLLWKHQVLQSILFLLQSFTTLRASKSFTHPGLAIEDPTSKFVPEWGRWRSFSSFLAAFPVQQPTNSLTRQLNLVSSSNVMSLRSPLPPWTTNYCTSQEFAIEAKEFWRKFSRACGNLIVLFTKLKQRVLKKIFSCLLGIWLSSSRNWSKDFEENSFVLVGIWLSS
jgi:hypothetical protein